MSQPEENKHSRSPDTKQRLLDAAGPVFAASGFDGATVREICTAADVNIASVGYYFGDKLGLYRAVFERMRKARDQRFPFPNQVDRDPRQTLLTIVRTILSRMLSADESGWESQLATREMQQPTPVFEEMVREFVRPVFRNLVSTMEQLVGEPAPKSMLEQLALSTSGQCFYYAFGSGVVEILIPEAERKQHYDIDSLTRHITAVMLSATEGGSVIAKRAEVDRLIEEQGGQAAIEHPTVETTSEQQSNV